MPPRARSRQSGSRGSTPAESPVSSPARRSRSTRRTDLSGMDLEPEKDDEEYSDAAAGVEEEEDEEDEVDEEEVDDDDDEEADNNSKKDTGSRRKRDRSTTMAEDNDAKQVDGEQSTESQDEQKQQQQGDADGEGEEEDEEEGEEEEEEEGGDESGKEKKIIPKKRGRKRTKLTMNEDGGFYDENGNLLNIVNDEVVIANEDPLGKEKIDEFGNLLGGRKFRNKLFTVLGQGDRKYMVSTEPARLVGFRDSYLLFKTHSSLFKRVCNHEEKMDLIERNIIPNSYKGRSVNLVAARSIFREFGAKVLVDGKKVVDDFWEQRARDNGDVEGEYADPNELFNYNMATSGGFDHQGTPHSSHNNQATPLSGTALVPYQNDPTWMYQVATQTRDYNTRLLEVRSQNFRGIKDVYTGLNFFPSGTQATKSSMKRVIDKNDSSKGNENDVIIVDTKFTNPDIRKKYTGLSSIPKLVIDNIQDETLKSSVLSQIKYEKSM